MIALSSITDGRCNRINWESEWFTAPSSNERTHRQLQGETDHFHHLELGAEGVGWGSTRKDSTVRSVRATWEPLPSRKPSTGTRVRRWQRDRSATLPPCPRGPECLVDGRIVLETRKENLATSRPQSTSRLNIAIPSLILLVLLPSVHHMSSSVPSLPFPAPSSVIYPLLRFAFNTWRSIESASRETWFIPKL